MKASNAHLRNSCDAWLLPTMVLASFGLFIAVGLASFGFLSRAQATRQDVAMFMALPISLGCLVVIV